MTHPTNLQHLANDKIRTIRAEGLRSQQLKQRSRRSFSASRTLLAAAGVAAFLMAVLWLI